VTAGTVAAAARLGRPELAPVVDELARRLGEGALPVTVLLRDLSTEQRDAVADLLGTARLPEPSARLRVARIAAAIGVGTGDLREVIERLRGPILDRRLARAKRTDEREALWEWFGSELSTLAIAPGGALGGWVAAVRVAGVRGGLEPHRRRLENVVSVLRRLPASGVILAALANDVLGDSHGLDRGRSVSTMVLDALAWAAGDPRPADAAAVREAWERAGVAPDPLSSTVLTLGLRPVGGDPLSAGLRALAEVGEPVVLTLSQLRRWPVGPLAPTDVCFVVENPSLVAEAAAEGWEGPPLVCSSGRPTVAVVTLLRQLGEHGGALEQHADFDAAGLAITAWLAERAGTVPWRMSACDYLAALNGGGRIRPSVNGSVPPTPWDPELSSLMRAADAAVYEEELRTGLLGAMSATARAG